MQFVESFEVDDGSLNGLSPQMCFVLGAEWRQFYERLKSGSPFYILVHWQNANRLVRLAERRGRFVEHSAHCEGWTRITVGDKINRDE